MGPPGKDPMRLIELALTTLVTVLGAAGAAFADSPLGLWYNEPHTGRIEITRCGDELCGTIVWLKRPLRPDGTPQVDVHNPEPTLRDRPILGLQILEGFPAEPAKGNVWTGGRIYDPNRGNTYSCRLTVLDADTMHVRGYIGVPWLGETQRWTRVSDAAEPKVTEAQALRAR